MPDACPCGREIVRLVGRGSPRKKCTTCSPRREPGTNAYVPRPKVELRCTHCGTDFFARSGVKYCSTPCRDRAKWDASNRVRCDRCGGPTGWRVGRVDSATCNACRGDHSSPEHGTRRGYRDASCRCEKCVGWNRAEAREYREKRRAEGRPIKRFGSSGPWIAPATRLAVFDRDNWECQLCGEAVQPDADPQSDWYPSLDHIVPQSAGGGHGADNLRLAHRWCNSIRGAKDYHADLFTGAR